MNCALKFAYDGRRFDGYARQPDGRTVEGEILKAMVDLGIVADAGSFTSASRTDKWVSAAGNVVSVETTFDKNAIIPALNSRLDGITFHGIAEVPDDFNPRHAIERWYRYVYLNREDISPNVLNDICSTFLGEHDFRHLAKKDSGNENTVLSIDSFGVREDEPFLIFDVRARNFVWQLVRRLVSTTLMIHEGKVSTEDVIKLLAGDAVSQISIGPMPPHNLILMDVVYDFEFDYTDEAGGKFAESGAEALVRAKVMDELAGTVSRGHGKD